MSDGDSLYLIGYDTLGWQRGDDWTFVLPDALGSVRQETDAAGAVTAVREWSPYGEELGGAQAGLGYTGEWFDTAVGLQYLRARWYDGTLGRFTQVDPSKLERNFYVYARANPVMSTDPTGYYSRGIIARSLGKSSFDEVLDWFEQTRESNQAFLSPEPLPRWGLLALLLEANPFDWVYGLYLDQMGRIKATELGWFLPTDGGCKIEIITRYNSILTLEEFINDYLARIGQSGSELVGDPSVFVPRHRQPIYRYMLGNGGTLYKDTIETDLPDYISVGITGDIGFDVLSVEVDWIFDRYGNDYISVGGGVGFGLSMPIGWIFKEGYVSHFSDLFGAPSEILRETELVDAIVGEDRGVSFGSLLGIELSATRDFVDDFVTIAATTNLITILAISYGGATTWKLPLDLPFTKGWEDLDFAIPIYTRSSFR